MKKKVFLTGATSFTGCHIARALKLQGYHVVGTLTRPLEQYQQFQYLERRKHSQIEEWIEEAPFGSEKLLEQIQKHQPEIFVNHGAPLEGYRRSDFDFIRSVQESTRGASEMIATLKTSGCKRVIHTGSIFEPDEGRVGGEAISIYGVSKNMTWQVLRFYCGQVQMPLSKVIVPNPIGMYENLDRLGPLFVAKWKAHGAAKLTTPDLIRDHLPAPWLAQVYVEECSQVLSGVRIRRPSAYALRNEDFVALLKTKAHELLKLEAQVEIHRQATLEVLERINVEPVLEHSKLHEQEIFWKDYLEWLNSLN